MSNPAKTTSACAARKPVKGLHTLHELALCGKLNIRGDAGNDQFGGAILSVLNLDLPISPNTVSEADSRRLYWLGPDEWLLHCDLDRAQALGNSLREACGELHAAITEVSDYYTVLQLVGPQAEQLIRKGCPLDIHPDVFAANDFAQTRFGHASILLHKLDDGQTWNIQVRWTYAEYVWDYLVSGMAALPNS